MLTTQAQLAVVGVLMAVVVAFNVAVSVKVAKAQEYEASQKRFQFLLVWFVPVVGAAICMLVLRSFGGVGPSFERQSRSTINEHDSGSAWPPDP